MRRTLTPFASLLLLSLTAQPTIQYSDVSPDGVQTDMYRMTSPGALPTLSDGADQTWDLSGITLQPIGTLSFTAAAGTPYAASYPDANWAWAQTVTGLGTAYTYLDITSGGIDILVRNLPLDPLIYSDPSQVMKFPLAFQETYDDTYVNNNGGSTMQWSYAGHGTAITPLGTTTDVAKVMSTEGDLLLWNLDPLYPILIDDSNFTLFFVQNNVGIAEQGSASVHTYPNPCNDQLRLNDVVPGSTWRIMDAQGRELNNGRVSTVSEVLDVSALATGQYIVLLQLGELVRRVSFVKA